MFFRFIRACKKYKFTFVLSTYHDGLTMMIVRPHNTFENIKFEEKYLRFNKLFSKAIKGMKKYRLERGC